VTSLSRVPIRLRLTLAFTAAAAVLVTAGGLLLYARFQTALDRGIDQSLRAQLTAVTALTSQADTGLQDGVSPHGLDILAQVLTPSGAVMDATPQLLGRSLLTPSELRRVLAGPQRFSEPDMAVFRGPARLLAAPVHAQGGRLVIVVGTSLDSRNQALSSLRRELLIGGPAALALLAVAGYLLAGAALRPVERLRLETDALSASNLGRRVTLSRADDEIRRLGTTLNALLARLEDSLERERRFVGDASHELRTPLALLKAELDLALRRPRSPDELTAAVRSAAAETDHIVGLAEDLLVLARADAAGIPLRLEDVAVASMLDRVSQRFQARARASQRSIVVDPDGAGIARIDAARLEAALGNVVDNALRHGAGTVLLSARRNGRGLTLHVADDGPGLPERFLPHAFERFSRPEPGRGGPGAGLGLSIVAAIATAHGGGATIQNRVPHGCEVTITLPGETPRA
jgi:signal transduction histidine kinase